MRIKIHHETHYHYDVKPSYLVQRLHLMPADFASQKALNWKVTAPGIDHAIAYVDGFGNWVHLLTADNLEHENIIVAEGEVDTFDSAGMVRGLFCVAPDTVFLRQTFLSMPDAAINNAIKKIGAKGTPLEIAHGLMNFVHSKIEYEIGTSQADTTASQVFAAGRGVCQDHSHLMISMARALGIPARYVTGYLVTGVGAASAASHAWAELLVADLGWVGFDAANGQCPTEQYVRVAAGLDAAAVAPVKGSRRGEKSDEHMRVEVRVEIAQQ
jgi:transglutaminase-like putative cysteine protease